MRVTRAYWSTIEGKTGNASGADCPQRRGPSRCSISDAFTNFLVDVDLNNVWQLNIATVWSKLTLDNSQHPFDCFKFNDSFMTAVRRENVRVFLKFLFFLQHTRAAERKKSRRSEVTAWERELRVLWTGENAAATGGYNLAVGQSFYHKAHHLLPQIARLLQ